MGQLSDIPAELHDGVRFGDLLLEAIDRRRARIAFVHGATSVTYAELGERIAVALSGFRGLGLQPGDTIAQLSGNSIELYAAMAAAYIGGYRSLTLHAMGGAADHAHILADSKARILIADRAHADHARKVLASLPSGAPRLLLHQPESDLPYFWQPGGTPEPLPRRAVGGAEDIVRLAYTGGTTGRPKGVMLSNRSLVTNTLLALAGIDWPEEVRFLCPAPISHGAGSIVAPTLIQGGIVILQDRFSPAAFFEAAARHRATVTWLVPTMLQALLDAPAVEAAGMRTLETLIYSGAPMAPARIRQALDRFGPILFQCYGQTEAPNTVLRLSRAEHIGADDARLASAGRPFPGVDVAILGDDGEEVRAGEAGEICVRGPLVMSGYWRQPEETAQACAGGWLHTGDIGRRDAEGYIHIVDRKKDMIISGGFNVFPKEVEDVLTAQPQVAAAAVVGVADPKWGETVTALVVLRPGAETTVEALAEAVRAAKGPVHTPKLIRIVEALPLTGLGKPDKKAIRESLAHDLA